MNQENNTIKTWYHNKEEQKIAEYIIGLEKSALDKFFNGDMSGYRELWSKESFTYFDGVVKNRVEEFSEMDGFLGRLEGLLHSDDFRMVSPRVQLGQNMGVLTFQLFARTNINELEYNCIEVFQKEASGEWHVIHSTWSFIRPMDKDFSGMRAREATQKNNV